MRIRKQAARMMAIASPPPPRPPPPPHAHQTPPESHQQQQVMKGGEETEEKESLMGLEKRVEMKRKNKLELTAEEEEEEKSEEESIVVPLPVVRCRRTDGKGWQCSREAAVGRPYCAHHLALLQARCCAGRRKGQPNNAEKKPRKTKRRRTALPVEPHMASEPFYYYSGFGPSRRRESRGEGEGGAKGEGGETDGDGDGDGEREDYAGESDDAAILNGGGGGGEAMRGEKPRVSSASVDA